jgi:preprotein translocase subunit SecF
VVTILFFLGGEVLRSFAFALIVGILIGTYSSLFVASPIVVEWQLKRTLAK